jgi:hypothetical protein
MTVEISPLDNDAEPTVWAAIPHLPVEGSFALTLEKGEKLEAKYEDGTNADVKYRKNAYTIEFEMFIERGMAKPIPDDDGVILTEYGIRVLPEDDTLVGRQMLRCNVSAEETFTGAGGIKVKYTFEGLKPPAGNVLQPYTKV